MSKDSETGAGISGARLRRFYFITVTASLVIQLATLVALVVGLVRL